MAPPSMLCCTLDTLWEQGTTTDTADGAGWAQCGWGHPTTMAAAGVAVTAGDDGEPPMQSNEPAPPMTDFLHGEGRGPPSRARIAVPTQVPRRQKEPTSDLRVLLVAGIATFIVRQPHGFGSSLTPEAQLSSATPLTNALAPLFVLKLTPDSGDRIHNGATGARHKKGAQIRHQDHDR